MGAIAAVVLVIVGWLQRERQRGGGGALTVSALAPEVTFERLEGGEVSLSSLRGKPAILVFWATWCRTCVEEMAGLERLADAAQGRYQVLAVSREPREKLARWARARPRATPIAPVPMATDARGEGFAAFRVESLPTHVIIDAEGRIVHDFSGSADPEILAEHMARLTVP